MKKHVLKQVCRLLSLIDEKDTPPEQLEALNDRGLFSILLDANTAQIDKEKFREVCGITAPQQAIEVDFDSKPLQETNSVPDKFRKMIDAGTMIVHRGVKVNRNRTPKEALVATGRKLIGGSDWILETMPLRQDRTVDLYYVTKGYSMGNHAWASYLIELGLVSDPIAQAADNEANPAFADDHPNGNQWKGLRVDTWNFAIFQIFPSERSVGVSSRRSIDWPDSVWMGGVAAVR